MSLPETSNKRPIREEIVDLAATLADTQAKLQQIAERIVDDDVSSWRKRYEELEKSHREAVNSAKWLRAQNIDLENKLSNYKPEMNNALTAREDAFRKLKHARKVIRDLLTERRDMSSPRSGTLTQEDIDEALDDGPGPSRSESSSSSNSSEKTVRLHLANSPSQTEGGRSSTTDSGHSASTFPRSGMVTSPARSVIRPSARGSQQPGSPLRAGPSARSFQSLTEMASRAQSPIETSSSRVQSPDVETWRVHFRNPPGVAVLQEGPITWDRLQATLNLEDDTANSLHSLVSSPDLGMKLVITHYGKKATVACLLDPILVDIPGKSYLLEWGRPRTNRKLEQYISFNKAADSAFHTFLHPPNKNYWFYVGVLEWTPIPAPVADLWTILDDSSRKQVLDILVKRTNGEVKESEIVNLLDSGALEHFWVELTAIGDPSVSFDFATEVLGRQASPFSPSSGRRAAGVKE